MAWASAFTNVPDRYFVVHGDDESVEALTGAIRNELNAEVDAPYSGSRFDLIEGKFIFRAKPVAVSKKKIVSEVFARLEAAGQRLLAVIQHNKGGANKDLAKFADQINSLCDKWDR